MQGDKGLKELRNRRWDKAFNGNTEGVDEESTMATNRKATIVIEHLIQASDVSHTMQHWYVTWEEPNDKLTKTLFLSKCRHVYRKVSCSK